MSREQSVESWSPHESCTAHSGTETKLTVLLTLATLILGGVATEVAMMISTRSELAVLSQRIAEQGRQIDRLEKSDERLSARLDIVESGARKR